MNSRNKSTSKKNSTSKSMVKMMKSKKNRPSKLDIINNMDFTRNVEIFKVSKNKQDLVNRFNQSDYKSRIENILNPTPMSSNIMRSPTYSDYYHDSIKDIDVTYDDAYDDDDDSEYRPYIDNDEDDFNMNKTNGLETSNTITIVDENSIQPNLQATNDMTLSTIATDDEKVKANNINTLIGHDIERVVSEKLLKIKRKQKYNYNITNVTVKIIKSCNNVQSSKNVEVQILRLSRNVLTRDNVKNLMLELRKRFIKNNTMPSNNIIVMCRAYPIVKSIISDHEPMSELRIMRIPLNIYSINNVDDIFESIDNSKYNDLYPKQVVCILRGKYDNTCAINSNVKKTKNYINIDDDEDEDIEDMFMNQLTSDDDDYESDEEYNDNDDNAKIDNGKNNDYIINISSDEECSEDDLNETDDDDNTTTDDDNTTTDDDDNTTTDDDNTTTEDDDTDTDTDTDTEDTSDDSSDDDTDDLTSISSESSLVSKLLNINNLKRKNMTNIDNVASYKKIKTDVSEKQNIEACRNVYNLYDKCFQQKPMIYKNFDSFGDSHIPLLVKHFSTFDPINNGKTYLKYNLKKHVYTSNIAEFCILEQYLQADEFNEDLLKNSKYDHVVHAIMSYILNWSDNSIDRFLEKTNYNPKYRILMEGIREFRNLDHGKYVYSYNGIPFIKTSFKILKRVFKPEHESRNFFDWVKYWDDGFVKHLKSVYDKIYNNTFTYETIKELEADMPIPYKLPNIDISKLIPSDNDKTFKFITGQACCCKTTVLNKLESLGWRKYSRGDLGSFGGKATNPVAVGNLHAALDTILTLSDSIGGKF